MDKACDIFFVVHEYVMYLFTSVLFFRIFLFVSFKNNFRQHQLIMKCNTKHRCNKEHELNLLLVTYLMCDTNSKILIA